MDLMAVGRPVNYPDFPKTNKELVSALSLKSGCPNLPALRPSEPGELVIVCPLGNYGHHQGHSLTGEFIVGVLSRNLTEDEIPYGVQDDSDGWNSIVYWDLAAYKAADRLGMYYYNRNNDLLSFGKVVAMLKWSNGFTE